MFVDANLSPPATISADVCIVGGGLAGLALADELAKRGRSVLGAAFGDVYRREALAGLDADDIVAALPEITSVVAFLCVERLPEACHRSLLAEWLSSALGLPVRHLLP